MTSSLELNTSAYMQQLATDQMNTDGSCAEPVTGALGIPPGPPENQKTGGIVPYTSPMTIIGLQRAEERNCLL